MSLLLGESQGVGAGDAPPPPGCGAVEVVPLLYDFILWMAPRLAHYPKIHRFTLGDRIMTVLLEILDGLIMARYDRGGQASALSQANLGLEGLRYLAVVQGPELSEPQGVRARCPLPGHHRQTRWRVAAARGGFPEPPVIPRSGRGVA